MFGYGGSHWRMRKQSVPHSPKRMIFLPSGRVNCQCFLNKRYDLEVIYPIYARILIGLIFWNFCAGIYRCFEFMGMTFMSCPEDSILWDSSPHSHCYIIFTSYSVMFPQTWGSRILLKMLHLGLNKEWKLGSLEKQVGEEEPQPWWTPSYSTLFHSCLSIKISSNMLIMSLKN